MRAASLVRDLLSLARMACGSANASGGRARTSTIARLRGVCAGLACAPVIASAQPAATTSPVATPAPAVELVVGGYLETYYQLQLQDADNRLTALRGFDNRSRTFTLSNVALDLAGRSGPVTTRIVLQVGHTGATYYLAEPVSPGASATNTSSSELWRYVQTATVAAKVPGDLLLEGGLFPSPIGLEVIPVKDNTHWSRSNLFFGLPFYHTGARASRPLGGGWTATLAVYNGWNSVVDNNGYPSVAVSAAYASEATTAQLLYFGGVERPTGAPEGNAWRNLLDAYVQHALTARITIAVQGDAGVEPSDLGTSWWAAAALYGRLALSDQLYAAIRGDVFYEDPGGASAIFWPVDWVAEVTATLAYTPADRVSILLEYRHDRADGDAYFGGAVAGDGVTSPYVPDRSAQDTVTLGATAWF